MEQPPLEVKAPIMILLNGHMVPIDHIVELDISALESHKTVVVITSSGHLQAHDEDAIKLVEMFGVKLASPIAPPPKKGKG